jgi:hypothetical protein
MSQTLLLQRRLPVGDAGKWRTVLRLSAPQLRLAEQLVDLGRRIDPALEWRLTTAEGERLTPPPP